MLRLLLITLFVVFAPAADVLAQGALAGSVRTAGGEPLPGATVRLEGSTLGDATDAGGRYLIENVPAGTYDVLVTYLGYEPVRRSVTIASTGTASEDFELQDRMLVLEDLVVTAQKRVQEIQDVPVAITSHGGDFLERLGVQELDLLSAYVPGLEVQIQSVNNPGFVVRGITSDDGDARVEPRVSVFQDGVSISKSRGSVVELFDLERVEVLKGPQGTLFGRGAQIGAVHIIQNKAAATTSARVEIGAGNFGELFATGYGNAPIVRGKLFGRVAALYNGRDGFVENLAGEDLNGKETFAVRTSLRWLPTERTVTDLIVNYQQDTPPGTSFKSGLYAPAGAQCADFSANGCSPWDAAALGPDPVLQNDDLFIDRTVWGATLLADHSLTGRWSLESITAYRTFDSLERFDADGTVAPALQFDEDAEGEQFSQEVRATYESGGRFAGFGGAGFFWEDGSQSVPFRTDERSLFALISPVLASRGLIPSPFPLIDAAGDPVLIPAIPNFLNPAEMVALNPAYEESFTNYGTTTAFELFIDGTANLTHRLSLTAGLRGTYEDVTGAFESAPSATQGNLGLAIGGYPNNLVPPTAGRREASETFTSAVGRLAAEFEAAPGANIFGTVARGRRPNVINVTSTATDILEDEIVWSYELGVKGVAADERLEYSTSGFFYDYSHFQTNIRDLDEGVESAFLPDDSGEATALGFESSVRALLARGVTAYASYAYVDATFDDTDADGNPQELAGNRFRLTPEHSFSLAMDMSLPLQGIGSAFLRPSYTWKSDVFFEEANLPAISQDAYGLLNVRGGLSFANERLVLEAFVRNALDEEFVIDAGNTGGAFGIPTYIAGPPRLYGVRLSTRI